jgi:VWFA-related protein
MQMRLRLAGLCGSLAVFVAGAAVTRGQTAPVFRSTTNLVQVDVIVHDNRDNFVVGLTADDLDVFEDGKPQRIQQLYLVTTDPVTGVSSTNGAETSPTDLRSHRVFVLVFDERDLEISALQRIKAGAEAFITAQFKDGDLGAVVVNGQFFQDKLTTS